jgi:hypothetical protein
MKLHRLAVAALATVLVAACAKDDTASADTAVAATAAPRTVTLADFAGTWQMKSTPESGADTATNTYVLTSTADTTGWLITYPSGQKVPLRVSLSGDSVMVKTGIFTSQRRRNVKVMTEGVARLQDGKLVGHTIAHYQGAKDSVLRLRTEGTRTP